MSRYVQTVESAAALGADTNFAAIVSGAGAGFKLRRVILGCRAGAVVPTSQQITVALFRSTARGTATATSTGIALDENGPASAITGVDTAWSVAPTLAASALFRWSFNTQGGIDVPAEFLEEVIAKVGTANGMVFRNIANALPTGHLITASLEWEE
jgi:hypothetical protein